MSGLPHPTVVAEQAQKPGFKLKEDCYIICTIKVSKFDDETGWCFQARIELALPYPGTLTASLAPAGLSAASSDSGAGGSGAAPTSRRRRMRWSTLLDAPWV